MLDLEKVEKRVTVFFRRCATCRLWYTNRNGLECHGLSEEVATQRMEELREAGFVISRLDSDSEHLCPTCPVYVSRGEQLRRKRLSPEQRAELQRGRNYSLKRTRKPLDDDDAYRLADL